MFLLEIMFALLLTKLAGMAVKRFGQPSVLGEVLAGILLGPSLLGLIHPSETILDLAEIGVILLMFIAGLETDLGELMMAGVPSTVIALGGVVLPFVAGPVLARIFGFTLIQGIMLGTILTATSVSISVQTLLDIGHLKSRQGTTILGAAIIDDILGIIVLTLVIGVTGGGQGSVLLLILKMVLYFMAAIIIGVRFTGNLLSFAVRIRLKEALLSITLAVTFLFAYLAEMSGVAAITGAYLFGALISRTGYKSRISERVEIVAYSFFIPIFFVSIGLQANMRTFDSSALIFALVFVAFAVATKVVGCGLTSRLMGFNWRQSLQVGIGMIPRAEVALVIASLALSTGVINQGMFSSVVLLVVVTTLITPPLLKAAFASEPSPTLTESRSGGKPQRREHSGVQRVTGDLAPHGGDN